MKCTRCRAKAVVQLRHHNSSFCRHCFLFYFERQVQRTVRRERMFSPSEPVLVAVSGGKDSLALWDVLHRLGYATAGLHLHLGIGAYSEASAQCAEEFARERGLRLIEVRLDEEGASIPALTAATHRVPCSTCGLVKRHYFDKIAHEQGYGVLATGHNLDDEAARLLGNVLRWQADYLARQTPVLEARHGKFARKVKPLFRISEYETAAYAFLRGIRYIVDECPNSEGATLLAYKEVLNRLEAVSPGTKLTFVQEFLKTARPAFASMRAEEGGECESCGMPSYGALCGFCALKAAAQRKPSRGLRAQ